MPSAGVRVAEDKDVAIHEAREAAKHARYAHGNGIVSGIPV